MLHDPSYWWCKHRLVRTTPFTIICFTLDIKSLYYQYIMIWDVKNSVSEGSNLHICDFFTSPKMKSSSFPTRNSHAIRIPMRAFWLRRKSDFSPRKRKLISSFYSFLWRNKASFQKLFRSFVFLILFFFIQGQNIFVGDVYMEVNMMFG